MRAGGQHPATFSNRTLVVMNVLLGRKADIVRISSCHYGSRHYWTKDECMTCRNTTHF